MYRQFAIEFLRRVQRSSLLDPRGDSGACFSLPLKPRNRTTQGAKDVPAIAPRIFHAPHTVAVGPASTACWHTTRHPARKRAGQWSSLYLEVGIRLGHLRRRIAKIAAAEIEKPRRIRLRGRDQPPLILFR